MALQLSPNSAFQLGFGSLLASTTGACSATEALLAAAERLIRYTAQSETQMGTFQIQSLDHVGLTCADLSRSVRWYEDVLGLKAHTAKEWGPFPVFMLVERTGIALFPANTDDPELDKDSNNVKINHFAFMVSNDDLDLAADKFDKMGLSYEVKDHHHFKSIYLSDPDGLPRRTDHSGERPSRLLPRLSLCAPASKARTTC